MHLKAYQDRLSNGTKPQEAATAVEVASDQSPKFRRKKSPSQVQTVNWKQMITLMSIK